jgi:sporulation protein YlmC with PRC-barrel domain
MTRIATALFGDYQSAAKAVRELEDADISYRDISVISNAKAHPHLVPIGTADDAVSGAGTGMAVGAALGGGAGLLAGLGLLAIPGFGPLAAVGWLAATAGGAAAGAAAGGMTGLLIGAGLSDEEARVYSEGVQRGGTLVVVRIAPERYEDVKAILARNNATDMSEKTEIIGESEPAPIQGPLDRNGPELARGLRDDVGKADSPVIKADQVEGTSVYDANGKHMGVVKRLMIDKSSGRVDYVVMSVRGFLGVEEEGACFIPWAALTYDTHVQGYRTNVTEDQVASAPSFSRSGDREWSDPERDRELHKHYGVVLPTE